MKRYHVPFFIFLLPAIGGESLEKEIQEIDRLLSARQIQEARTRGGGEEYLVFGLTLLGEQLLAGGEIHRAEEILLPETGRREGSGGRRVETGVSSPSGQETSRRWRRPGR